MEWPKVKNIIILILLLFNGFLLTLVLASRESASRYEQSAVTGAVKVLAQNGIEVSEGALTETHTPGPLTAVRDLDAEQALARKLLGEDARATDQSGGLYAYTTGRGTALFRAGGEVNVQFTECPLDGKTPAEHAASMMEQSGLKGELLSAPEEGEHGEVVYCQTVDGLPVYSCRLVFRYGEGRLLELSGTLMTGAVQAAASSGEMLDLPTTLIRFMSGILERGDLCSSVTALRPGYRLTQAFDARFHMNPVWLVTTNVGSYYVDGVTGELEPCDM